MSTKICPSNIFKHTNNAFNIRHNPNNFWQGQTGQYKGFAAFKDEWFSIRAVCILLRNYRIKYGIDKISAIITRFAPPNENDTEKYIQNLCSYACVAPDNCLSLLDYHSRTMVICAIARIETNVYLDYQEVFETVYLID